MALSSIRAAIVDRRIARLRRRATRGRQVPKGSRQPRPEASTAAGIASITPRWWLCHMANRSSRFLVKRRLSNSGHVARLAMSRARSAGRSPPPRARLLAMLWYASKLWTTISGQAGSCADARRHPARETSSEKRHQRNTRPQRIARGGMRTGADRCRLTCPQ